MPTIRVNVRNRVATANGDSRIINGNSDYNIEFDFDAEWADLNNKIGIFAYNDAATHKWAYQPVMFSGNTCAVPILRDIHCVYVGVTAGNVRVTTPAKVQCRLSISDYADTEEPPSADIWGQILAKLDELQTEIDEIKAGGGGGTDISLGVTGATVGQTVNVKAVDADGKPTAWEAVDMAAGGGAEVYYAELDGEYPSYTLSADTPLADIAKAYEANKSIVCRCKIGVKTATLPLFIPMPKTNTWFFSGAGALGRQYPAQTFTVAITPFGVEAEQRLIAAQTALDAVTVKANEAVLYTPQKLNNEQKQQAQKNIGINPEGRNTSMTNPVGVDDYGKLWSKSDTSLNVTGATVGQTIKVKAVDADGKPTAWEAVNMAAGDTEVWEKVCQVTTTENVSFIYQPFDGYYKKIRAIFAGESTVACQVWIYPNTETRPGGADIAYIFNAPYAAAGPYTIVGELSTEPYPSPDDAKYRYLGKNCVERKRVPGSVHTSEIHENYIDDFYAKDISQGVKSLYWTQNAGEIKAGAQMVVYGVKA